MDYWKECVSDALDEVGIDYTVEQIEIVAEWVDGAHQNFGMYHGYDCIPNPANSEIDRLKREIEKLKESYERQIDGVARGVARRRNVNPNQVSIDDDGLIYIHDR